MLEDLKQKLKKLDATIISTNINEKGIAILFDFIEDETLTTEAAITDNYVAGNFAIQDHIAIKPKIYRLRGCIGEVVYRSNSDLIASLTKEIEDNHPLLQKTINIMKPIGAVSGVVSNYTQAAMNVVKQIENSYNRYKKMLDDFLDPSPIKNKRQQEVASILNFILENRIEVNLTNLKFDYTQEEFKKFREGRKFFLQSVSSHQGSNNFITDIEITVKEVRMAETEITTLDKNKFVAMGNGLNVSATMKQTEVNSGNSTLQSAKKSGIEAMKTVSAKVKEASPNTFKYVKTINNAIVEQNTNLLNTPIIKLITNAVAIRNKQ